MSNEFFYREAGGFMRGPLPISTIRIAAGAGRLARPVEISREAGGPWTALDAPEVLPIDGAPMGSSSSPGKRGNCEGCGKKIGMWDADFGGSGLCGACRHASATKKGERVDMKVIESRCRHCRGYNEIPEDFLGKEVVCPLCKESYLAEIETETLAPPIDGDIYMDMDLGTWMKILGWLVVASGIIIAVIAAGKEEGSTVGLWIAAFSSVPWASIFFTLAVLLDRSKMILGSIAKMS